MDDKAIRAKSLLRKRFFSERQHRMNTENSTKGEHVSRAILKVAPPDIVCLHNLGTLGIQRGKYPEAVALEILRHQPDPAMRRRR